MTPRAFVESLEARGAVFTWSDADFEYFLLDVDPIEDLGDDEFELICRAQCALYAGIRAFLLGRETKH
jgi:hypothetical protein